MRKREWDYRLSVGELQHQNRAWRRTGQGDMETAGRMEGGDTARVISKESKTDQVPLQSEGQSENAQGRLTHEEVMGDMGESRFCGAKEDEGFTEGNLRENTKWRQQVLMYRKVRSEEWKRKRGSSWKGREAETGFSLR